MTRRSAARALGFVALALSLAARPTGAQAEPPASSLPPRPRVLLSETRSLHGPPRAAPEMGARRAPVRRPAGQGAVLRPERRRGLRAGAQSTRCAARLSPGARLGRDFCTYAEWAMAFDWVYASPAFDTPLKDKIAGELARARPRSSPCPRCATPDRPVPQPHPSRAGPRHLRPGRGRRAPFGRGAGPAPARAGRACSRQRPRADRPREPRRRLPRVHRLHAHHVGAARHAGRAAAHAGWCGPCAPVPGLPQHGHHLPLQGPPRRIDGPR